MMNDYLVHRDHKYIKKIGKGKDARYFYTQAEIDAYNKKKGKQIGEDAAQNATTAARLSLIKMKRITTNPVRVGNAREDKKTIKRVLGALGKVAINSHPAKKAAENTFKIGTSIMGFITGYMAGKAALKKQQTQKKVEKRVKDNMFYRA